MTTTPNNDQEAHGPETHDETGGTSEETSLTVKKLGTEWIVENGVGRSVGSAATREAALSIAKDVATSEKASSIALLAADGSLEKMVPV